MRDVLKRIEALEHSAARSAGIGPVAIHFISPGEEWNPQKAYRNLTDLENSLHALYRENGESVEAFQDRAAQAFTTGLYFLE